MKNLNGMWAVVTGASSGIGEEYARQLAERGASVIVVARRQDRLDKLAEALKAKYGVEADTIALDLSKDGSAQALFSKATAGGRKIQILVNNAGIGAYGPFLERPLDRQMDTIKLNLFSLTETTYLFAQHMLSHGKPSYVSNVASIASFVHVPRFAVYSGSKYYVRTFSEALHFELKGSNIQVSCLCPGGTYTEFLEQAGQSLTASGRMAMMSAAAVAKVGIDGMLKGKPTVVPGLINKLMVFLPRIMPRSVIIPVAGAIMSQGVNMVEAPAGAAGKGTSSHR
ncbi:MAG TPA: SDR family oxidoreductase [Bdellovibrionota bacterium]|jgi:short-subunit dehydrogenase|nr:SDR family oxidoreductase [Bdellovibrionota bacterium]